MKKPSIIVATATLFFLGATTQGASAFRPHHRQNVVSSTPRKSKGLKKVNDLSEEVKASIGIQGGGGGTATIPNEIFNLVKSIVGAGVLSLPAGIAAFGNAPSAVLPAVILIIVIGSISGYGFSLIGRVCAETGAQSYREAWDKTVGPSTSWITAASSSFSCIFANLAYSMILADTFQNLLASVKISVTRTQTLFGVTTLVLLPLCLLKDLSSLAPFSLLGIMGMAYTTVAMLWRLINESYAVILPPDAAATAEGVASVVSGNFLSSDTSLTPPSFGTKGAMSVFSPSSFILIGMLSTAYMAHFNAPKFYIELKDNTIERYNTVVSSSFGISIAIFCAVAAIGFLTFGETCDGLILNNYSNMDTVMSLSRVAVAVSIVFSYPLVFVGSRDGIIDLANIPAEKRTNNLVNNVTLITLAAITGLALIVKDLSFVLSFCGSTLGNALIYVFPALMFRSMVKNIGDDATSGQKLEVVFAMGSCLLGLAMGGLGAYMSIKSLSD